MIKGKGYTQLGHAFVEIDAEDHPNLTLTTEGWPSVVMRYHENKLVVNVIDKSSLEVELLRNNRPV